MRQIRNQISAILVRWHMPTRQVAINEIVQLVQDARIDQLKQDMMWVNAQFGLGINVQKEIDKFVAGAKKELSSAVL